MLFGIIGWAVLGLIVGFIASKTINLHGDDPKAGIVLSAFAAVLCGWVYWFFKGDAEHYVTLWSMSLALAGAGAALLGWHMTRGHSLSRYT